MHEIAEGVWHLPLLPRNIINAFLIGEVLVDTGVKGSAERIAAAVGQRRVSAIALTHAHVDHTGSLRELAERYGVPVWCGAADREAVEAGRARLPRALNRPRLRGLQDTGLAFDSMPVTRALSEGDELGDGFTVIDTPGHSAGHISFWRESDRTLICGDVFVNLNMVTTVPGLGQPPGLFTPDPKRNRESERRLAELEPTVVGFGHGPPLRDDAAGKLRSFVRKLPA